jgi:hypothetical protein
MSQYLTTVEGSPSKPSSFTDGESPKPTSTFPSEFELAHPPVKRRPKTMHLSAEPSTNTTHPRTPRERRPLSFSDFVIPDQVLAKQKELKRGIGAVKKFAGGVQCEWKRREQKRGMVC